MNKDKNINLQSILIKKESVLFTNCKGVVEKIAPDFDHHEIKNSLDKKKEVIEERFNLK